MSDLPPESAPKKRVVRSRIAAPSIPAGDAAPAARSSEPTARTRAATAPAASAPPGPVAAPNPTALRTAAAPAPSAPAPSAPASAGPGAPKASGTAATAPNAAPASLERAQDAAANAALALAVMGSRRESPAAAAAAPAAAPRAASRAAALMRHPAAQAAALVIALAAGWLGAEAVASVRSGAPAAGAQWTETAQALRQGQQDVIRLTGDIKTLKVAIESLKESVDRSKADLLAKQAQVIERVERAERAPGDGARLAKLAEQLDRVEALGKEPAPRLAALTERFERLERQLATQPIAAKPAADGPTQTGTLEAKPPAKEAVKEAARDTPLEGWTLHEVYDGVALVEGRNRRLYEVGLGGVIPGVGAVESIERRGKRWMVVTQKGYIGG